MNTYLNFSNTLLCEISQRKKRHSLNNILYGLFPRNGIDTDVRIWRKRNLRFALPGFFRYLKNRTLGIPCFLGELSFAIISPEGKEKDFGLISLDLITNVGAAYIVSSMMATQTISNLRYHALGSSNASLLVTNTALATELASSYSTPNTRQVGTATQGSSANIFVSVASTTFTTTVSVAEWGLFSQASTLVGSPAGGTLFDRSTFATQNVLATFAAKTTYTLTVASGT